MPHTIQMPTLGESVTEGTITRWLKHVGDYVEVDEPLLEVSTDKVDTEVPSTQAGVLMQVLADEEDTVEVGGDLAVIGGESKGDEAATAQPPAATPVTEPEAESVPSTSPQGAAANGANDEVSHVTPASAGPSGPASAGAEPPSSYGASSVAPGDVPYATPLVRKLATERGVDLHTVTGSGVDGRIHKQDVLKAAGEPDTLQNATASSPVPHDGASASLAGQPAADFSGAAYSGEAQAPIGASEAPLQSDESRLRGTTQTMSRRRATIAKRMVESLQVSAQLTTVIEVDLTRIARLRDRAKADFQRREGVQLSFLPFMALATVEALKAHPGINASVDTEKSAITYHGAEHLGIAVDTPAGLIVPVIPDAGHLNLTGLTRKIADVADRARASKLAANELSRGTFTITNTGSRGALIDTPIINQPEVGILGTGAVVKKPSVVTTNEGDESIAIRFMAYLCLTYDHRIVDGADAARFLGLIKDRLEAGAFEPDLGL